MRSSPLAIAISATIFASSVSADDSTQDQALPEMIVTATKSPIQIEKAPASVSVITSEELERLPATDITTALESLPGVHITKTSGSEAKINIRGVRNQNSGNGNYTLILVNGQRMSSSEALIRGYSFDLSSIPMKSIERVEVIRGPMSSLYGSEALGGVVNIILKQPTNETQTSASITYSQPKEGGGTLKSTQLFSSGSIIDDQFLYTFSLDVSDKNKWVVEDPDKTINPQSGQERAGFNTNITWLATDADTLNFGLGYLKDDRHDPDASDPDYDSFFDSKKLTASVNHTRVFNWGESESHYFYERSEIYQNNSHPLVAETETEQTNHNFDTKLLLPLNDQHDLTTGLSYSYSKIDNTRDYDQTYSTSQAAVYLQDQYAITDDLEFTLSGRYTHHDKFGDNLSPRAYLVYSASDDLTIKGGFGAAFKAPTMFQSNTGFSLISCGGDCYLIGNPDLKPQTSKSFELSTAYNQDTWFVQATGFYNKVKDQIDRDTSTIVGYAGDGKRQINYVNTDEVITKGLELEAEVELSDTLYLSANATYTKAIDKSDNSELTHTPKILANINLNWEASHDLSMYTGVNYTGKQLGTAHWNTGLSNKLKPYSVVNLGGKYQINNSISVSAGLTNVFDKRLDNTYSYYSDTEIGRAAFVKFDFEI